MKTIIWIDEESDLLYSVVEPLEWAGHRVLRLHTAQEGRVALDQIRRADLLLLDLELPPGVSTAALDIYPGLTLLNELREKYHVATPAVVLTTVTRGDILQRLSSPSLAVVDVVRKPVLPSELKERISRVLQSPTSPAA